MSKITPIEWTPEDAHVPETVSKEDGELSSDGDSEVDELGDIDYNILPRPTTGVTEIKDDGGVQSMDCNVPISNNNLEYSDGEEDLIKHDSSSDSDSDEPTNKKSFGRFNRLSSSKTTAAATQFINPNAYNNPYGVNMTSQPTISIFPSSSNPLPAGVIDADISTVEQKMMSYQEKRKNNKFNIWSDLLQAEEQKTVLEKFEGVDVSTTKTIVERGPETYTYNFKPNPRKRKNTPGSQKKKNKSKKNKEYDSDISSAGLSDDDVDHLRSLPVVSKRAGEAVPIEAMEAPPPNSVREMQDIIQKLRGRTLCKYMAEQLQEPKYQLIVRACEILGKEYCMHMFMKTMKIEKKGGLLIKSKTRKRTPGGTFFYMIRNDNKNSEEKINLIFELDRKICMKDKRERVKERNLEGKAQLEKFQHRHVKLNTPVPEVSKKEDDQASDYAEYNSAESNFESDGDEGGLVIDMDDDELINDNLELENQDLNT